MCISKDGEITEEARRFLEPTNATHRQYEALRAYFVDRLPSAEAATRFGYSPGSFRVMCHDFRKDPDREFFLPTGRRKAPPQEPKDQVREEIVALRKQNLSIYDISRTLKDKGITRSPVTVGAILKEEGFARLPRRRDEERPLSGPRVTVADVADVRELDLSPRHFHTKFGGLFLFVPYLSAIPLDRILTRAGWPGSQMIPPACAVRSLLALKLFGTRRHSHVMAQVLDQGLALFAGLNRIPKRSFLTEYSCRVQPESFPKLMRLWFDAMAPLGLDRGDCFHLDFHTIPFHGEDALVEKHYVSKRSRRQKGILAFLAQDADRNLLCYCNSQLRKGEQNDEILRFVQFWKQRTGRLPEELIFDSKLTTYENLDQLNRKQIDFITLRRRSQKLVEGLYQKPASAWRRIELKGVSRIYRTPRVLDQRIQLTGYQGPIRQLSILDLGHEEPTLLLTNQLHRSPATLIKRYARRMLIENAIEEAIEFFHIDALSSAVAMKVDCDLQLTLMASSLYRLLGHQIGNGYATAKAAHIFRDFIDATANVTITSGEIVVRFQKRAHNPLLRAVGLGDVDVRIPWLGNKRLRLQLGE
jgi:hypothetical protein